MDLSGASTTHSGSPEDSRKKILIGTTNNNYFKVVATGVLQRSFKPYTIFFDDRSLSSTRAAWVVAGQVAKMTSGRVSVNDPPRVRGQWDSVACVVGHRHYREIMEDVNATAEGDDMDGNNFYHEELGSLQARWSGRVAKEDRN